MSTTLTEKQIEIDAPRVSVNYRKVEANIPEPFRGEMESFGRVGTHWR